MAVRAARRQAGESVDPLQVAAEQQLPGFLVEAQLVHLGWALLEGGARVVRAEHGLLAPFALDVLDELGRPAARRDAVGAGGDVGVLSRHRDQLALPGVAGVGADQFQLRERDRELVTALVQQGLSFATAGSAVVKQEGGCWLWAVPRTAGSSCPETRRLPSRARPQRRPHTPSGHPRHRQPRHHVHDDNQPLAWEAHGPATKTNAPVRTHPQPTPKQEQGTP